jgi:hypothetical protein
MRQLGCSPRYFWDAIPEWRWKRLHILDGPARKDEALVRIEGTDRRGARLLP